MRSLVNAHIAVLNFMAILGAREQGAYSDGLFLCFNRLHEHYGNQGQ